MPVRAEPMVFIVDDDTAVRESLCMLLKLSGYNVEAFDSAKTFLTSDAPSRSGCLIVDIRMPGMDGLELQEELVRRKSLLPIIVMTGHGDVPLAVRAMKTGAVDFLEKPFARDVLLNTVRRALDVGAQALESAIGTEEARKRLALLTKREREVFELVVVGKQNKIIAFELGASVRTIEIHRARMMSKMQAQNLQELVRMAMMANLSARS